MQNWFYPFKSNDIFFLFSSILIFPRGENSYDHSLSNVVFIYYYSTAIVKRVISRVFEPIINQAVKELERKIGGDKTVDDDIETETDSKNIKVIRPWRLQKLFSVSTKNEIYSTRLHEKFQPKFIVPVFMKSASLSVKTSKIIFCPTKYFILSDRCPAEITKITMINVLQNWVLSYKKLQSIRQQSCS